MAPQVGAGLAPGRFAGSRSRLLDVEKVRHIFARTRMLLALQESTPATRCDPKAVATVTEALAPRFGNRMVASLAVRQQHANTTTWIDNEPPDVVVFAHTTEDVQAIVKACAANRVPVICFGTGTSLQGHVNAPHGGVSIDVSEMKRVIAVHPEDLDCVVDA